MKPVSSSQIGGKGSVRRKVFNICALGVEESLFIVSFFEFGS